MITLIVGALATILTCYIMFRVESLQADLAQSQALAIELQDRLDQSERKNTLLADQLHDARRLAARSSKATLNH